MFGIGAVRGDLRFGRHGFWNAPSYASFAPRVFGRRVGFRVRR
jgi:hypothetical protein